MDNNKTIIEGQKNYVANLVRNMSFETVRDFCGSMRGFASQFSEEEILDTPDANSALWMKEIYLHWLPIALNKLVRDYHFGISTGTKDREIITYLKNYVTGVFYTANPDSADFFSPDTWHDPETINAVYDAVFVKPDPKFYFNFKDFDWNNINHINFIMSIRIGNTIGAILQSDKYLATDHCYKMIQSKNKEEKYTGEILLKAVNDSVIEDIKILPEFFNDMSSVYSMDSDCRMLLDYMKF